MRRKRNEKVTTYNIANFLGRMLRMGRRVKQTTKRATAARLRPPKMRMRSQRLTVRCVGSALVRQCFAQPAVGTSGWSEEARDTAPQRRNSYIVTVTALHAAHGRMYEGVFCIAAA